jgi:type IV secretory pathway TrbD component
MVNMNEYKHPVRRSLMERELLAGVPQVGLLIILIFSVFFIYGLQMYYMAVPAIILYIVMRILTKKDPYMVDIIVANIQEKDIYI